MAMPRDRSWSRFCPTTPISDSLLVRTASPSRGESFGRPSGSACMRSSSSTVPSTPPEKTTLRAVKTRFLRPNSEPPTLASTRYPPPGNARTAVTSVSACSCMPRLRAM